MADSVDPKTRSWMMSRIRGKDTAPEYLVRRFLHRHGLRFRLHSPALVGHPDLALPACRTVVFVHGCYWHQHPLRSCPHRGVPQSNRTFWLQKFARTRRRDRRYSRQLQRAGWHVEVIWECEASKASQLRRLAATLHRRRERYA